MASTDKDSFRIVPCRFLINGLETDICKLEKLTNLFPDMKAVIELELFKFNNLSRLIDRLSHIYPPSTDMNTRDDILQYHLGPYHLSLGPATFGALHFRNISTALLASSSSKITNDNTNQYKKRRHEAALRRFRRAVRKLILIKSLLDKLRLASILTPYNQYELYKRGIYDLVLAGRISNTHSGFNDDSFIEEINAFRSTDNSDNDGFLFSSNYMKINNLLQLMSSTPHQQQSDTNIALGQKMHTTSDVSSNYMMNENHSESSSNSKTTCCSQHREDQPLVMLATRQSISHQSNHFISPEIRARLGSNSNSRRNSSTLPTSTITNSLPDLTTVGSSGMDKPSSRTIPPLNVVTDKSKNVAAIQLHKSSSPLITSQEDALINRISSLLTSYTSSRQSSHTHDNHETLENNTDSNISNHLPSVIDTNEFDKLLQSIKTIVDNKLSVTSHNNDDGICSSNCNHQILSSCSTTCNHHEQLLSSPSVSLQETPKNEYNGEQLVSSTKNGKLNRLSESQTSEETN